MTNQKRPDPLSKALGELPAQPASEDFTERVLARLRQPERSRHRGLFHLALGTAGAIAVALAALLFAFPGGRPGSSDQRVEQLRRERSRLLDELEQLERARGSSRPVVYLGASSEYDLVLDLDPLLAREDSPVVPALQDLRLRSPMVVEAGRREP